MRASLATNEKLELVEKFSPAALAELPVADLYVIDGDHNYATVRGEVDWILANAPDAVIVFHDLMWPCGRRDFYYQPTGLPQGDVHPDTDEGATVWHDGVTPAGFIGAGSFTVAREAGGERNGVLTAVEDALAPWGPRAHWGKVTATPQLRAPAGAYDLAAFEALRLRMDPEGVFRNELLPAVSAES